MAFTTEQVASFARINVAEPLLPGLITTAETMVDVRLGESGLQRCPDDIRDLAILTVVRRLWDIRQAANGLVQYGPDGETSVISADPMKPAYPLVDRYRGIGAVG